MSETINNAVPEEVGRKPIVEVVKKKRGFAAHKPGCQCRYHRKQRGETVITKAAIGVQDPMDRKLNYFRYSLDPGVAKHWQSDESLSPLHLEKEFTERYPDIAFKYLSTTKIDRLGRNYHGWEIFHDGEYPEGRKLGNDLILGAKPKADNEEYKQRCLEKSERNLRRAVASSAEGLMPGQQSETGRGVSLIRNQAITRGGRMAGEGIEVGVMKVRQQGQPGPEPAKKSYFIMGGK